MILIIDMSCHVLGFDEFVKPIANIIGECSIKRYNEQIDLEKYDKIILSGTYLRDNSYLSQISKFDWIPRYKGKFLGICAGMQVLGLTFGSKLIKCKEVGMTKIITTEKNPLISGDFSTYELHNYSIIPSSDFLTLAKSNKCAQAIKHKSKEFYGALFHPEVRNSEIIKRFISV